LIIALIGGLGVF